MPIKWTDGGSPYAESGDYEASKYLTKEWAKTTPEGQEFISKYYTEESLAKITEQLEFHNLSVSLANLTFVYTILRDSGQLTAPIIAAVPDVPRDRNGKALSPSQLEWREFAIWANDPKTSTREINEKRKTNASFAKFYRESLRAELVTEIDGAVVPTTGEYRPTSARGRL